MGIGTMNMRSMGLGALDLKKRIAIMTFAKYNNSISLDIFHCMVYNM